MEDSNYEDNSLLALEYEDLIIRKGIESLNKSELQNYKRILEMRIEELKNGIKKAGRSSIYNAIIAAINAVAVNVHAYNLVNSQSNPITILGVYINTAAAIASTAICASDYHKLGSLTEEACNFEETIGFIDKEIHSRVLI